MYITALLKFTGISCKPTYLLFLKIKSFSPKAISLGKRIARGSLHILEFFPSEFYAFF